MTSLQTTPFHIDKWLGNDTWGYTRQPRQWHVATSHSGPSTFNVEDCTLQSLHLPGEERLTGAEVVDRATHMRSANADVFETLRRTEPQEGSRFCHEHIPKSWQHTPCGRRATLLFLGTIFENDGGQQAVLYLTNHTWENAGAGNWQWGVKYLHNFWYPDCLVLTVGG